MRMAALANAPVSQLTLVSLRLEPAEVPRNHRYMMRAAPVERFIYITRGQVRFMLQAGEVLAGERDMVYLPRDTEYHSLWLEDARFMVVDLCLEDAHGQELCFGDAPCVLFNDPHHVYDGLLAELAAKADAAGPFDWLERMSLALKLVCEMARDTLRNDGDERFSRIKPGVNWLENNYAVDCSVDDLARMCAMSAASFRRLFFEYKGLSPVDYRNSLRIRRAAELLKTGRYLISEAAEMVGISDVKYFGKLFRQYTGLSPGVLKKKRFWSDEK